MSGRSASPHALRPAGELADRWADYGGESAWTRAMRRFAELGGLVRDYGGMPQSRSAIPLTFTLHRPDGSQFPDQAYRLKDIRAAIALLEAPPLAFPE